jgi:hypothetical protein
MTKIVVDVSVSVDGFLAGPNATLEQPLGAGGDARRDGDGPAHVQRRRRPIPSVTNVKVVPPCFTAVSRGWWVSTVRLVRSRVIESPGVAHLGYRIAPSTAG